MTKTGPRLSIAIFETADINDDYIGWLNDPSIMSYMEAPSHGHTLETARAYVQSSLDDPNSFLWRVMLDGDRHIGNIRLSDVNWKHRRGDVAVLIGDKSLWGQGYAVEAVRLASQYAFEELGLNKLTAGMYQINTGSIRAFEKAGFSVEATRPQYYVYDGTFVDGVFMGLLKENYLNV